MERLFLTTSDRYRSCTDARTTSKLLIVYATRGGQTEKIAWRLSRALEGRGHATELFDLARPGLGLDPEGVDAVVLCAPIYAQGYPRSALEFARCYSGLLARVPTAFVSVGLAIASKSGDGRAQTLPIVEKFLTRAGFRPARVELVAGALLYTRYGFLKRYVMRRIARAEGGDTDTSRNYEYTDWRRVDQFALEFARDVESGAPIQPETPPSARTPPSAA
jgi:menaquinone-dependent protoporphyrinogen oxidase